MTDDKREAAIALLVALVLFAGSALACAAWRGGGL